jgi:hypothetical protein
MSLTGINLRARPKGEQRKVLSQWMSCSRFVWNAKCEENDYLYKFKQKFLPINIKTPIDQSYSQFKDAQLSPWLSDCPRVPTMSFYIIQKWIFILAKFIFRYPITNQHNVRISRSWRKEKPSLRSNVITINQRLICVANGYRICWDQRNCN